MLGLGATSRQPPDVFVDKGACPFECCAYPNWSAIEETKIYASRTTRSPVVAVVMRGQVVRAVTGEVHTRPARLKVLVDKGQYRKGSILYVLTPRGEGVYRVWYNGSVGQEEIAFLTNLAGKYPCEPPTQQC